MDYKDAIAIFENNTKRSVVQIERCSVGIANYVFIVSTANEKFVLRWGCELLIYRRYSRKKPTCLRLPLYWSCGM